MSLKKKKPKISQRSTKKKKKASASFSTSVASRPSRQGRQSTLHCEANKKVVKKTQVRNSEWNRTKTVFLFFRSSVG